MGKTAEQARYKAGNIDDACEKAVCSVKVIADYYELVWEML
jgi:hypothetical protein